MRLSLGTMNSSKKEIAQFSQWLLQVGDGVIGDNTDGEFEISLAIDILIPDSNTALDELINFAYPNIVDNIASMEYFKERTILAPILDIVHEVNNYLMSMILGDEKIYLSSDSLWMEEGN